MPVRGIRTQMRSPSSPVSGGNMSVAGRVSAGLAAVVPAFAFTAPASADVLLQAQTTATAIHVTVTQRPASSIITASLLDDAVAYAAGDFDSGGSSEALAAPAFPGRLVVQGPQLLCSEVFSCPAAPPSYPLLADASYPRRSHDTAQASGQPVGSGPFVVTPLTADAKAGALGNTGSTAGGSSSVLAGTPGAVTVGASSASSTVTSSGRGLRVQVRTTLTDIAIGGVVHIATLDARDDLIVAAGHRPTDHPSVTVTGVTAAGQPASIDDRGVHVPGADGPSVTQQLDQAGISIRTVGTHRADTRTGARSDATALLVEVAVPVSGVPYVPNPLPTLPPPFDQVPQLPGVDANGTYVADITLGAVGAAAGFGAEPTFDLGGVGTVHSRGSAAAVGSGSSAGAAPTSLGQQLAAPHVPADGAQPQLAAPQSGGLRGFFDDLTRGQVQALYAAVALGSAVLFVGWRGAVLLRHGPPGARRRR